MTRCDADRPYWDHALRAINEKLDKEIMQPMKDTLSLVKALDAEGFPLPQHCREARVILGVDRDFMLQYDVLLTPEAMAQLGRALQRVAEGEPHG